MHTIFIAGLTRDVCVRFSAVDAADSGFDTFVLWDLCRPVEKNSDAAVRKELSDKGVRIIESKQLEELFAQ